MSQAPSRDVRVILPDAASGAAPDAASALDVLGTLPHRAPFLFIDRVAELERGVRLVAERMVRGADRFLAEYGDAGATMPHLLVLEALAQAGALLLMSEPGNAERKLVYFATITDVTFHDEPVRGGDLLTLEVRVTQRRGPMSKVRGTARAGTRAVCEATLGAMLVDRPGRERAG